MTTLNGLIKDSPQLILCATWPRRPAGTTIAFQFRASKRFWYRFYVRNWIFYFFYPADLRRQVAHKISWGPSLSDIRELSQGDAARCATQEATNLDGILHSSACCALQALSRMSDAASAVYCRIHVMHERIPSPGKVSDWLILQLRRTSRTTFISAITVLDSMGRMVSSS